MPLTSPFSAINGLKVKLKYLDQWNNRRRAIAKSYNKEMANPKVQLQKVPDWADPVYHLFVVIPDNKEAFVKHLADNNIVAAYHYPVPCHLQKAYAHLNYKKGDFPNAERLADNCVSLPMYAELTDEQVAHVIKTVNQF